MEDIDTIAEVEGEIADSVERDESQTQTERSTKKNTNGIVNKRIDFESKSLKRIEMMTPAFRDEVGPNASANDVMSYIVGKGIDALFDGEFKNKLNDM